MDVENSSYNSQEHSLIEEHKKRVPVFCRDALFRYEISKDLFAVFIMPMPILGGEFSCFKGCVGVAYHVSASSKSTRSGRTGSSPMTVCM